MTEQHDPNARPAISNSVSNMEQYDVVFLGCPIWNNDAPRIIYTFLESENLNGLNAGIYEIVPATPYTSAEVKQGDGPLRQMTRGLCHVKKQFS